MIRNGLNSEGINSFWQLVFTGGITLFAAVLDSYKSRDPFAVLRRQITRKTAAGTSCMARPVRNAESQAGARR